MGVKLVQYVEEIFNEIAKAVNKIGLDLAELATLPILHILCSSIYDFMQNIFGTPESYSFTLLRYCRKIFLTKVLSVCTGKIAVIIMEAKVEFV